MHHRRGNILFLILLAVVLFAALAYAVTSSMRGGGKDVSDEKMQAMSSSIMQYGNLLANAIGRMMLVNDCKDTQISFELPSGANPNPSAPATCKVFDPEGGGMTYQTANQVLNVPNSYIFQYDLYVGSSFLPHIGTTCNTGACSELLWLLELSNKMDREKFCAAYNKTATGSATILTGAVMGSPNFVGTYGDYNSAGLTSGGPTACLRYHSDLTRYFIYYVLLSR